MCSFDGTSEADMLLTELRHNLGVEASEMAGYRQECALVREKLSRVEEKAAAATTTLASATEQLITLKFNEEAELQSYRHELQEGLEMQKELHAYIEAHEEKTSSAR